jgi:hypothetical protein
MKHYYREKIVKTMVNCVEQEIEFPNINVLDAINTLAEIWTVNVKSSTISNCPYYLPKPYILLNVMMKIACRIWGKKTSVKFVTVGKLFELALDQQRKFLNFLTMWTLTLKFFYGYLLKMLKKAFYF